MVHGTRLSGTRPISAARSQVTSPGKKNSSPPQGSGAIDHWSIVLFYSMGIGTVAVAALLFALLMAVWLYGQFVWTFTHWDLAHVRLTPFKPLAQLVLLGTFLGGTCAGLWCFSGAAWKNRKPAAGNAAVGVRRNPR
jgi:hypothetical protein